MFQLDKHDATLSNVNLRKENHGDGEVRLTLEVE